MLKVDIPHCGEAAVRITDGTEDPSPLVLTAGRILRADWEGGYDSDTLDVK
jgi:hypothetical protein